MQAHDAALRFITCGSVDDGKSTLIGRMLLDSKAVLQDQLAQVTRYGQADLAQFTDGLSAEREQGITIDVAYRYFASAKRKFIIGDAPGHVQYTRNMVTAASLADAAVVLVDATKLDLGARLPELLPQTRRHALLAHLLGVPALIFAVNKLDAVDDAHTAFARIASAVASMCERGGMRAAAVVPVSALHGQNVVNRAEGWCAYLGPSLLQCLEALPAGSRADDAGFALPVQWIETFASASHTHEGRRVIWGRVAAGSARVGMELEVHPGSQRARVVRVLNHARDETAVSEGQSAGLVLDRELDVSRGDWLLAPGRFEAERELRATVAWLDEQALEPGRVYWALHGHRWVKAKVTRIAHRLDIHTFQSAPAHSLGPNDIGEVWLQLAQGVPTLAYEASRKLGAMVLVDTATHRTAGAVLLR